MIIFLSGRMTTGLKYGIFDQIKDWLCAWKWSKRLWREGHIVYSPHLNNTCFNDLMCHEEWMERDFKIIEMCDAVYFLPHWRKSKGACLEHNYAMKLNRIIKEL